MKFEDFIARTANFEAQLRNPAEFFAAHAGDYLAFAKQVAASTMNALRPPEIDPDHWRRRTEEVLDAITIAMLTGGDGVRLTIHQAPEGQLPEKGMRSAVQAISFQDVMDWITAGLEGKPGGKRLQAGDEAAFRDEKAKRVRASIIMKAYYGLEPKPSWQGLRYAIQRWLRGFDQQQPDAVLAAIATAWRAAFMAKVRRDLAAWLGQRIARFGRASESVPGQGGT